MNYHNITKDDMLNGEGLRVVLWVAGCEHHCDGCQNPVTWNPVDGLPFDTDAKYELFEALSKDYISGITFSGGDPLHQNNLADIGKLAHEVKRKFPKKTVWLYTGYTWEQVEHLTELWKNVDVLVDGRFNNDLCDVSYPWAGSTNQRVIDVQKTLKERKVILYENH
ncbi:MAG: anaerobic ribonucleoside-triphosphate reductase activating protein [Eubacteriales bacterium]|nr:anaerobic ribonucleoside-triphosphate reductase activating protein [Eubacteriales bacterium]